MTEQRVDAGIDLKVPIGNGVWANLVTQRIIAEAMYPASMTDPAKIYVGESKIDKHGVEVTPFNSVLRFESLPDDKVAVLGNTKHTGNGCPVAEDADFEIDDCSKGCALAGLKLATTEMSRRNCARANTATAFEYMGEEPRGRFMLLPTKRGSYVVGNENFTPEHNEDLLLQNRLQPAMSVVFTEPWMRDNGLDELEVALNGADGSVGVNNDVIEGERVFMFFASLRQNMGDREIQDQVVRQAYEAYFDSREFSAERRARARANASPSITFAASASLANFAHKIHIPGESPDAPESERLLAAQIREAYADEFTAERPDITSAMVLDFHWSGYAGAVKRKNVIPEFEAKLMALDPTIPRRPISFDRCPGDGQTCNVDYRAETEYAIIRQLSDPEVGLGIPRENIDFDMTQALDPSDPTNKMASNRAEQNEGLDPPESGVTPPRTNRTLNGLRIRIAA